MQQPHTAIAPATISITPSSTTTIYQHDKRPEWGHAIIAWERGNKRGYQFEDGKLRVFQSDWYHLLSELDEPLDRATATARRLQHKLGTEPATPIKKTIEAAISFDDQLTVFGDMYPDGFDGDAWRAHKRGEGRPRRVKRHRDPAVADARDKLSAKSLEAWIEQRDFDGAWAAITGVLRRCDLVSSRHVKQLESVSPTARRNLTLRVRELLWADERYEIRFERFVAALGLALPKPPSWQVTTALSALVHPELHICIRPNTARAQAAWMAPRVPWSNAPSASLYTRLQTMARAVHDELVAAGHAPRDLLDVHDFMWETLRPKALARLEELSNPSSDEDDEQAAA